MAGTKLPVRNDYNFSEEVTRDGIIPVVIVDLDTGLPTTTGGGGGGGTSTIADGADVTQGAKSDTQATDATSSWSVTAILKGIWTRLGNISLVAGENHIGQVGGTESIISPTVTVSTSPAYSSGDCVGGKITITNAVRISGGSGLLKSIFIIDKDNQKSAFDIFIFNADPSAGTYIDNGALTINATDQAKLIRRIQILASDYVTAGGISTVNKNDLSDVLVASGSANLYAVVNTTSTPTYTTTTSLVIRFGILQD